MQNIKLAIENAGVSWRNIVSEFPDEVLLAVTGDSGPLMEQLGYYYFDQGDESPVLDPNDFSEISAAAAIDEENAVTDTIVMPFGGRFLLTKGREHGLAWAYGLSSATHQFSVGTNSNRSFVGWSFPFDVKFEKLTFWYRRNSGSPNHDWSLKIIDQEKFENSHNNTLIYEDANPRTNTTNRMFMIDLSLDYTLSANRVAGAIAKHHGSATARNYITIQSGAAVFRKV